MIVEGKVDEPRILGNESHGLLSLIGANYEIVPFANPIYELYEAYKNNTQEEVKETGSYITDIYIDNDITIKEIKIP